MRANLEADLEGLVETLMEPGHERRGGGQLKPIREATKLAEEPSLGWQSHDGLAP